jgi:hypothetical protein
VRQLKRDRLSCRGRPHQTTDGCVGFPSSTIEGARNRIPGGSEFFLLASGGNLLRRPWIWSRSGCWDLGLEWSGGEGEAEVSRSRGRGGEGSGGEEETRSAGRGSGRLFKHTWATAATATR